MTLLYPRPLRGALEVEMTRYGTSVLGAPLIWFPAAQADSDSGLVLAGTHGDERGAGNALLRPAHSAQRPPSTSCGAGGQS